MIFICNVTADDFLKHDIFRKLVLGGWDVRTSPTRNNRVRIEARKVRIK